jgi:flagellar biogenesis protein FliO
LVKTEAVNIKFACNANRTEEKEEEEQAFMSADITLLLSSLLFIFLIIKGFCFSYRVIYLSLEHFRIFS